MKLDTIVIFTLSALLFVGCSGIKTINLSQKHLNQDYLYSKEFLTELKSIRIIYQKGRVNKSIQRLKQLREKSSSSLEKARLDNLLGTITFSKGRYIQAINYFKNGLKHAGEDFVLTAQIKLNLGGTHYRSKHFIQAYSIVRTLDEKYLSAKEKRRYFRLLFILAQKLGDEQEALEGLVKFFGTYESLVEIKTNHHFDFLVHSFDKMGRSEKVRFLEKYSDGQNLATGYLGFIEARRTYLMGERKDAFKMLTWVHDNFPARSELQNLISELRGNIKNISKIDHNAIGIILPFSGQRSVFANRSMMGIDFAIRELSSQYKKIKVHTSDSRGDPLIGRRLVKELIEKHSVSIIIGGLFSDEAKEEYLEARKYGVMFISLAQIFISRKEKGFLLLEVSGSVESQVRRTLAPDMIEKFGKRVAVIYPFSEQGRAYINEVWTQTLERNIDIISVQSYSKGTKDFRDPVAHILGLRFSRLRQEELEFMKSIFALEESSIRRIQVLSPVVNFDWVYLPVYPQDAIQIVPAFTYYDAEQISFIGGPSWRTQLLGKVSKQHIHFIGGGIDQIKQDMVDKFIGQYKTRPQLVEINAWEAIYLVGQLLRAEGRDRESYNDTIKRNKVLQALSGKFELIDNLWMKDMHPFKIEREKANRI